jgi:anti-anti-sigma factor
VAVAPDGDDDVGGDPACWAHLFDEEAGEGRGSAPEVSPTYGAAMDHRHPELHIDTSVADAEITLDVSGDVDAATAGLLEGEVRAAFFGSPEATTMVLDLSQVGFMDSSGLRVIIAALRTTQERGGTLRVRNPSPAVAQLLEVTRLTGELEIVTG